MFLHVYTNRLKCLIRDKQMVFWTFLFPIVLSTLFALAFSNLNSAEKFNQIPVAVVDDAAYQKDKIFQGVLTSVSDTDDAMLAITLATADKAKELLQNGDVDGIIQVDSTIHLTVKDSGINQSILKEFLDQYLQVSAAHTTILTKNPAAMQQLMAESEEQVSYLKDTPVGKAQPNTTIIYFYALLAMASLYGGFWGMREVSDVQADHSPQGARISVAPVHKLKIFGSSLCAATTLQVLGICLLLAYQTVVLGVDFGQDTALVVLTCIVGSFTGVSFGAMVGAIVKKSEGLQVAVLLGVSMVCSFLSGLMYVDMKYITAKAVPILAYINPANLITDALYSLYYYESYTRFYTNIGLLCGFAIVFYFIVYLIVRRQKYASL